MKDIFGKVPENQKEILKSVGPVIVIAALFVIAGKIAFAQITNLRNQILAARKSESVLSDKLEVLRTVSDMGGVDFAVYALPKSNPVVQVVEQLKRLSAIQSVVLSDIKSSVSSENKGADLTFINTTFKISGTRQQVMSFISGLETISPITLVDKVDFSESNGVNTAGISTKTYFSPLPSKIPSVTQAVTDLTVSEKTLISQISKLTMPAITDTQVSSASAVNVNPFGE